MTLKLPQTKVFFFNFSASQSHLHFELVSTFTTAFIDFSSALTRPHFFFGRIKKKIVGWSHNAFSWICSSYVFRNSDRVSSRNCLGFAIGFFGNCYRNSFNVGMPCKVCSRNFWDAFNTYFRDLSQTPWATLEMLWKTPRNF